MKQLIFVLITYWPFVLFGQSTALGTWTEHLSFRSYFELEESESEIFALSQSGIVRIDKNTALTDRISKINGLYDVEISTIAYHHVGEQLLIGYKNGHLDLLTNAGVLTISDIAQGGVFFNRAINDIQIDQSNNIAYIATGFGLVLFDLLNNEFLETVIFDNSIMQVQIWNDRILVQNGGTFLEYSIEENKDIQDLNQWQTRPDLEGMTIQDSWTNGFIFSDGNILYNYNAELTEITRFPNLEIEGLTARDNRYIVFGFENDLLTAYDSEIPANGFAMNDCLRLTFDALIDASGNIWFGHQDEYVARFSSLDTECLRYYFNSPYSNNSYRIRDIDFTSTGAAEPTNQIWITAGGLQDNFNFTFNGLGFYVFNQEDNFWLNFNQFSKPELTGLFDFYDAAYVPENNTAYISTYSNGLIQINQLDSTFVILNENNSILENGDFNQNRMLTTGMQGEGSYLWVCNTETSFGLKRLNPDGTGLSFSVANRRDLFDLLIDDFGNKWITLSGNDAGVAVFNEGDPDNPTDDKVRIFTRNNSALTSNRVYAMAKDLNGDIWFGTDDGVVVMECSFNPFEDCDFSLRIVEQNEFDEENSNLFNNESVFSIAVDGANRKWMGTRNGVFLIAEDGREQLMQFTESNSPLPDNQVNALAVDAQTGQVFMGTNNGVVSYQGNATTADSKHETLVAFPNPVRPDYEGPIAVKGMAQNSLVKVTEPNGKLVFEGRANGGLFTWYGVDYLGNKVAPGVYLIFSSNEDNLDPEGAVTKVLIMR